MKAKYILPALILLFCFSNSFGQRTDSAFNRRRTTVGGEAGVLYNYGVFSSGGNLYPPQSIHGGLGFKGSFSIGHIINSHWQWHLIPGVEIRPMKYILYEYGIVNENLTLLQLQYNTHIYEFTLPIIVEYDFAGKRIRPFVFAGTSLCVFLAQPGNALININGSNSSFPESINFETNNILLTGGIGCYYFISKKISIYLKSSINYFLIGDNLEGSGPTVKEYYPGITAGFQMGGN